MSAKGSSAVVVEWRRGSREIDEALRLLAAAEPDLGRATQHIREAWRHVMLATSDATTGPAATVEGSMTAGRRVDPDREPGGEEAEPSDGPPDDSTAKPTSDEDTDGGEQRDAAAFARQWLRTHYGDDAHVEGACVPWIFDSAGPDAVPPRPAELRTHALWLRTRIFDHLARRGGTGPLAIAMVVAGFFALLAAVLFGELVGADLPWRGEYYSNEEFKGKAEIDFTDKLEFNFGRGPPLESMPKDEFSIRWTTCLQVEEDGEFAFELTSDDGSRLFVDGVQVVDNWGPHGRRAKDGSIDLEVGPHLLEVEYFDRRYEGKVKLHYDAEGGRDFALIPPEVLKAPAEGDDPCE
ncbi:MAG: PA14 domain-containing protein [Myxococcota bacterium]